MLMSTASGRVCNQEFALGNSHDRDLSPIHLLFDHALPRILIEVFIFFARCRGCVVLAAHFKLEHGRSYHGVDFLESAMTGLRTCFELGLGLRLTANDTALSLETGVLGTEAEPERRQSTLAVVNATAGTPNRDTVYNYSTKVFC